MYKIIIHYHFLSPHQPDSVVMALLSEENLSEMYHFSRDLMLQI